ncbi:hypothetical protein D3C84_1151380 [compost metagenome]
MSARKVILTAALPWATTGKNTAEVKKPRLANSMAMRLARAASPQWIKRIAMLLPCCAVRIRLSKSRILT